MLSLIEVVVVVQGVISPEGPVAGDVVWIQRQAMARGRCCSAAGFRVGPVLGQSSGDVGDSVEVAKSWIRGRWRLVMSMESEGGARLSDV